MRKNWVWFVLAAAVALAVVLVVSGRLQSPTDDGPHVAEDEMATEAEFDRTPPTGDDMKLDEMDISFGGETNRTVRGEPTAKGTK